MIFVLLKPLELVSKEASSFKTNTYIAEGLATSVKTAERLLKHVMFTSQKQSKTFLAFDLIVSPSTFIFDVFFLFSGKAGDEKNMISLYEVVNSLASEFISCIGIFSFHRSKTFR